MDSDYKHFCLKCGWLDSDLGCCCPPYEEVYQCPMYFYYHPLEYKDFINYMGVTYDLQSKICSVSNQESNTGN